MIEKCENIEHFILKKALEKSPLANIIY